MPTCGEPFVQPDKRSSAGGLNPATEHGPCNLANLGMLSRQLDGDAHVLCQCFVATRERGEHRVQTAGDSEARCEPLGLHMGGNPAGRSQFPCRINAPQPRMKRADVPIQIQYQFSLRPIGRERTAGAHGNAPDRHRPVLDVESTPGHGGAKSAIPRDWHIEHRGIKWGHVQLDRQ